MLPVCRKCNPPVSFFFSEIKIFSNVSFHTPRIEESNVAKLMTCAHRGTAPNTTNTSRWQARHGATGDTDTIATDGVRRR